MTLGSATTRCYAQRPATLTKDGIYAQALKRSAAITSLDVSFTGDQVAGPTVQVTQGRTMPLPFVFSHRRIAFDESRFVSEHNFAGDPFVTDVNATRWVAFNGVATSLYVAAQDGPPGILGIDMDLPDFKDRTGKAEELTTSGIDYFDMQLLNPPTTDGQGIGDLSLISLLQSDSAVLREKMETVDGRECHVIDLYDPSGATDRVAMTVWTDPKQGSLPIHQCHYTLNASLETELLIEFAVTDSIEIEPGLWLATDGWKKVYATSAIKDIPFREWEIHVDRDAGDTPLLAVNIPLPAGNFDIWDRVPAGTDCFIEESQESWIARADDVQAVATQFLATASLKSGPDDAIQRFSLLGRTDDQSSHAWSITMMCSIGGAGLFLLIPWRRRRPSSQLCE
ncbi:MAG: hypothetical protein D8M59_11910 [Planctomycetes bacterium]|nr:hypothetical protein [Planctomycetota bacterium]